MSPAYVQAGRPMRVSSALGPDVLLLAGLTGEERVSAPYRFTLDLLSTDAAIGAARLLGQPIGVEIEQPSGEAPRRLHGVVSRLRHLGAASAELHRYQVELVPWLWMLGLSSDCRIFQNLSVPEIVEAVFQTLGHTDYQLKLVKSHPPREYCVQYRESHLAFVSRLLEEEGIFYFFRHEAGRHVLVLADGGSAVSDCPGVRALRVDQAGTQQWGEHDVLTSLTVEHAVHTAKVALADYNYLTPSTPLEVEMEGEAAHPEAFDYPGSYGARGDGERYARLRLEAHEAMREVATATSRCPGLVSGHAATVAEADAAGAERRWLVLGVTHQAVQDTYLAEGNVGFAYENQATLIPADAPYHPPRTTPAPRAYGTQSALVTGPGGAEIHTDAHGRVKLHFFWDRHGRKDDTSSCWVRVATAWAGKGWGQFSIPRIGQEVLVEFVEGNPDCPVVVGRVFNAEQTPPCDPGGTGGVVSGLRSKTHRGSGYNAMELDDTAGKEQITIHAQYDLDTTVLHDERVSVGNDRTETVAKNESVSVGENRTESVGKDETVSIGANQTHSVAKDQTLSVGKNQTLSVEVDRTVTVGKKQATDVGTARTTSVGADDALTVGGKRSTDVAKDDNLSVGKKLVVEAGDEIVIRVGNAVLAMKKDGTIKLSGKNITISGTGKVNVKASSDVVVKGSNVKLN